VRTPPVYEHCTFDSFDPTDNPEAVIAADQIVEGAHLRLLLLGPAGTGKTHLAIATGKAYERPLVKGEPFVDDRGYHKIHDDIPARVSTFWTVLNLAGALRAAAGGRIDTDPESECISASLLVLDDWGAERTTDYVLEAMERIVDNRYLYRRPTVITSNIRGIAEWIDRYGDRIISRMCEQGRIVELRGRDRRTGGA